MKTQFKTFAVALVAGIFSFSAVLANGPIDKKDESKTTTKRSFDVGMYRIINSMKVNVLVDKQDNKALDITVKNDLNEVVYTEVVGKNMNRFSKKLDLSGLTDGKYRIEISNGKETVAKEVNVETHAPIPSEYRSLELK